MATNEETMALEAAVDRLTRARRHLAGRPGFGQGPALLATVLSIDEAVSAAAAALARADRGSRGPAPGSPIGELREATALLQRALAAGAAEEILVEAASRAVEATRGFALRLGHGDPTTRYD